MVMSCIHSENSCFFKLLGGVVLKIARDQCICVAFLYSPDITVETAAKYRHLLNPCILSPACYADAGNIQLFLHH